MQKNKYQSHESKHGNVWVNIWDGESNCPKGKIEVEGDTTSGYHIIRRGSLNGRELTGLFNIALGDAGVFFDKRKDAENFALVIAMHFSGDLVDKRLLDPRIFHGCKSSLVFYSEKRTELFWRGVDTCNPWEGWRELDPENTLESFPGVEEPLPRGEDEEIGDWGRAEGISEAAEGILDYYAQWILTPKVEISFHEIVAQVIATQKSAAQYHECFSVSEPDRSYTALLALAALHRNIPVSWILPSQSSNVAELLPRLQDSLPPDVNTYIQKYKTEDMVCRTFSRKVENLKAEIFTHLPDIDGWKWSHIARSQVHCCACYYVGICEGMTEAPSHSEPEYIQLMANFSAKASVSKGTDIDWLVTWLKKEHM